MLTMKILITHFSQTGNTEKIAKAIGEVASQGNDTEIKKMEEVDAGSVSGYDFIFIGSPLHASNLAGPVKKFLEGLQTGAAKKLVGYEPKIKIEDGLTKFTKWYREYLD